MELFSLWILLIATIALTSISLRKEKVVLADNTTYYKSIINPLWIGVTILLLAFYTSNTIANDVYVYRENYSLIPTTVTWKSLFEKGIGSNPLFGFIQVLFIRYISSDPATFHFFEGLVVQTCLVLFYRRYSPSLSMSLFMTITSGLFYFTMVSWKHSIAMGVGLIGITLIQQRRYILYYALLALMMLIHPYIIMYATLPLLINNRVWTTRNILILITMCIAGYFLSEILGAMLEVTETVFGDSHDANWFSNEHGVSWQRILFFAITPVLSVSYRKQINAKSTPLMNGFIQMAVISFGFMFMAMYGGANFISRMATYFEPFTYVALPYILMYIIPKPKRAVIKWGILTLFLVFFCFLQLKMR